MPINRSAKLVDTPVARRIGVGKRVARNVAANPQMIELRRLGSVEEINRYAPQRIRLTNPSLAELLVSGTFSVDDAGAFARAVAQVFSLRITEDPDTIVLGSAPDRD